MIRPPVGTPQGAVDATPALTREQLAALWRLDVPLREKTLWRMLYETSARAEEIVSLDDRLCVPRIPSTALTSRVVPPAVRP